MSAIGQGKNSSRKQHKPSRLCQNCLDKEILYVCPRCAFGSCSLHCCKTHKERQKCNGKRDKTGFKRLREMTDGDIRSDYHFLEEIVDQRSLAQRLLQERMPHHRTKCQRRTNHTIQCMDDDDTDNNKDAHELLRPPSTLKRRFQPAASSNKHLQQYAQLHNITLHCLPPFMERHKQNQSGYKYHNHSQSNKSKVFYWTVEWKLCQASRTTTQLSQLSDTDPIGNELERLFGSNNNNNNNNAVVTTESHRLFLKRLPCPNHQPVYIRVSTTHTLQEVLRDQTVIEFPTLYIVPHQQQQQEASNNEFPTLIQSIH